MQNTISKENAEHYTWGSDCDSWILVDTEGMSIKQECMPASTKEQLHFHTNAQQFFFMIKGEATFYINDEKTILAAQKGLHIKPLSKHLIANETNSDIEFLVISQPSTNNDRTTVGN
jgi:mannose-6-phosphate isomerase-like protein (cupin superfamily)